MAMEIGPIVSTLRRHRTTAWLLVLEIALTCAIVCNAVFLIGLRLDRVNMPSGVAEQEVVQIQLGDLAAGEDRYARAREDLALLRRVPGVQSVALSRAVPFGGSGDNSSLRTDPAQRQPIVNAATYFSENLPQTLGTRLVAGRELVPDDYVNADVVLKALNEGGSEGLPAVTVVTRALAARLWPGQEPLGRTVYLTDKVGLRVVGVLDTLVRPNAYRDATAKFAMIVPLTMGADKDESYLLRTHPQDRQRVLKAAVAALRKADPQRVVTHKRTFEEIRRAFFRSDREMAGTLLGVCIALLTVTALGIVGLASFWVSQRRRTIGVRRALGATRTDILRYFQTENFLLATAGIVLGMALAYGLNLFLMAHYELPRLPAGYLPAGALALWLLGQLAVLGPALRAAEVPPVVATRSA